jgi:hypothetical protein
MNGGKLKRITGKSAKKSNENLFCFIADSDFLFQNTLFFPAAGGFSWCQCGLLLITHCASHRESFGPHSVSDETRKKEGNIFSKE